MGCCSIATLEHAWTFPGWRKTVTGRGHQRHFIPSYTSPRVARSSPPSFLDERRLRLCVRTPAGSPSRQFPTGLLLPTSHSYIPLARKITQAHPFVPGLYQPQPPLHTSFACTASARNITASRNAQGSSHLCAPGVAQEPGMFTVCLDTSRGPSSSIPRCPPCDRHASHVGRGNL